MPNELLSITKTMLMTYQNDIEILSDLGATMEYSVSAFIVSTCRILQKSNTNVSESIRLINYKELNAYFILSGSYAEFFVQPLHPCFGDVDCLTMKTDSLAFTDKSPALPYALRHIADPIKCMLIEPCLDYPGFVRLRLFGEIKYNWERNIFEFEKVTRQKLLVTKTQEEYDTDENVSWVGPSNRHNVLNISTIDLVQATWCPQWPNEARDWPLRLRKHGWPTADAIQEVIQ